MQPLNSPTAIIDFCLAPLNLDTGTEAEREVRRRLEHGPHQVGVIVGKGARGRDLVDARHGLQGEGEITDGGAVGHGERALLAV